MRNYNAEATDDDGSCVYAEAYFDCDGNCLNDADGDLVCDELEVDGCTDETACNYSEAATEEDGSCTYARPTSTVTAIASQRRGWRLGVRRVGSGWLHGRDGLQLQRGGDRRR